MSSTNILNRSTVCVPSVMSLAEGSESESESESEKTGVQMLCSACLLIVLVCRRAQEAAAASEREAAAAAEEAERASWQAEHAESEGVEDEQTQALRRAASKWTKRCLF